MLAANPTAIADFSYQLRIQADGKLLLESSDGVSILQTNPTANSLLDGQWHFVAASAVTSGDLQLIVDGIPTGSVITNLAISNDDLLLIAPSFTGAIDDLKLHFNMPSFEQLEAMQHAGEDPVLIQNNLIGTNGNQPISNGGNGISISDEMKTDVIGNTIGGNLASGIHITHYATGIRVQGNYVGTNSSNESLGNATGILVDGKAHDFTIGGTELAFASGSGGGVVAIGIGARNFISGNTSNGIELGQDSYRVSVQGNFIGTASDGLTPLANGGDGVLIRNGAHDHLIGSDGNGLRDADERNTISGNLGNGIRISGEEAHNNQIFGNYVGTNDSGNLDVGNGRHGIWVEGAVNTTIGSRVQHTGNLVSGNGDLANYGNVAISSGATGTVIQGNIVGLNSTGTASIDPLHGLFGIQVLDSAVRIGGSNSGDGNVISGHKVSAVSVRGLNSAKTSIEGNFIGLGLDGVTKQTNSIGIELANTTGVIVGGNATGQRNYIAGNGIGVLLTDGSFENNVLGNFIGVNTTEQAVANSIGVSITGGASANVIGGPVASSHNLISGNQTGVKISGNGTMENIVVGNYIGTDPGGLSPLANVTGIEISNGASDNRIDGGIHELTSTAYAVPGISPWQVATGDFNSDGKTDMVVATNGALNIMFADGNGGFTVGQTISNVSTSGNYSDIHVAVGDINGDQELDLIATTSSFDPVSFQNTDGALLVYLGLGGGFSTIPLVTPILDSPYYVATGDFNEDGRLDVAVSGADQITGTRLAVYLGSGNGAFSLRYSVQGINRPFSLTIADLNRDGNLDIVADTQREGGTQGITPYFGNGDGSFNPQSMLVTFHSFTGIQFGSGVADFNGDGIPDIVAGAENNSIAYFQGTGNFGGSIINAYLPPVFFAVPNGQVGTVAVGDFNGDGFHDVAANDTVGATSNAIGVLFGNGNGSFSKSAVFPSFVGNNLIAADFDNDGRTDIAMTNYDQDSVTLLRQVIAPPNVISGNTAAGVSISGNGTARNSVAGNYIGIGSDGKTPVANSTGLQISNGAANNIVGGQSVVRGNVIGSNLGAGVKISSTSNNTVQYNAIGLTAYGDAAANNVGIHVSGTGSSNFITDNEVRFSTTDNILIEAIGNSLRRNVTADMGGVPIRLVPSDLSPGQVSIKQVVNGANPVILGEVQLGAAGVQANLALPNAVYTVDIFSSPTAGQASRFVASQQVSIDSSGFGSFSITPGIGALNGFVTATVTGPGVNNLSGTSSLSNSLLGTPVIILGLRSQSPEGTPITLSAFASTNVVTGYLWEVEKDGAPYVYEQRINETDSEGGIQFTPDNQGDYTVTLRVTLSDGSLFQVGPFTTKVYNLAPTVSLDYAPTAPAAGQLVTLQANNSDPGQQDVLSNSWSIRYGSPSGPIVFSTVPSTFATETFVPSSGGLYYVTLTAYDGDGGVQSQTREIEVNGLPAVATILLSDDEVTEGQVVRARVPESELSRSEQLTFNWKVTKGLAQAAYPVSIPSRGVVEFIPNDDDTYTITLSISDGINEISSVPAQVIVNNAVPRILATADTDSPSIGLPIHLQSIVSDLGVDDSHTIQWRVTRNQQQFGQMAVGQDFTFTPTSVGAYVVTATVFDNHGDSSKYSLPFVVTESPVDVSIISPAGPYMEDGTYTFTAQVPAGVESYAWRARTTNGIEVASSDSSVLDFVPTRGGEYQIELRITLADGRVGNAIVVPLSVEGVAPIISDLYVMDPTQLVEGSSILVRSEAIESHESQLTYKWELKKPGSTFFEEMEGVDGSPFDFRFTPTDNSRSFTPFVDTENGEVVISPDYEVRLTITDPSGLIAQRSLFVSVANADPLVRLTVINRPPIAGDPESPIANGPVVTFQALASDPGIDDVPDLRYTWIVNGDVVAFESNSNILTTAIDELYSLVVQIADGDGGFTTRSFFVLKGSEGDDQLTLDYALTSQANADDQILFLALGGNDSIYVDSSVINKVVVFGGDGNDTINAAGAAAAVLLDGGDGNDYLVGGQYDDVLIAGSGTNVLYGGDGNNRFVGGGNDSMVGGIDSDYYEVHFSEVNIYDLGGADTIDLSAAQAGIKLDLSNNLGAVQQVFPGSTLAINGNIETLLGSNHNDDFTTSTNGTTIDAGLGNDRIVVHGTSDVRVRGGQGNDDIELVFASGIIEGGDGADHITGTLIGQFGEVVTQIHTGAGDDAVEILNGTEGGFAEVSISLGSGKNSLNATGISGKVFATNGGSGQSIDAFGAATNSVASISVSNSGNIGIFGTALPGSRVAVSSSSNVGIFGSGIVELNEVSLATIQSTEFGAVAPTTATVKNSSNIGIFGAKLANGPALNATVNNSSNVSIFGTVNTASSRITVLNSTSIGIFGVRSGNIDFTDVHDGENIIEISDFGVTSKVTTNVKNSSNIGIFGAAFPTGPELNTTVSGSSNVGIFGAVAPIGTIAVSNSSSVDIFGVASPVRSISVSNSTSIGIFGAVAVGKTSVDVTNSSDVDIFGSATAKGSILQANVTSSSNVSIFGSAAAGTTEVTVNDSQGIDVFGSVSPTGSNLKASVLGSSNVGIFGTSKGGDSITVAGGHNIEIYGILSGDVLASKVTGLTVYSSAFGNPQTALNVIVKDSSAIDVFGSSQVGGPALQATVSGSTDVDIFGSTKTGKVVVESSTNVGIFGTSKSGTLIKVSSSQDIEIYSGRGDQIELDRVARATVDSGVFGAASGPGVTVSVAGGSSNVAIFGTLADDEVSIANASIVNLDLRSGDDRIDVNSASFLVAITDDGVDRVTVRSGKDMLFYLGDGNDQSEILGGEFLRVITDAGADEFFVQGGRQFQLDGGDDDDLVVVAGGDSFFVRSDRGQDKIQVYGGTSLYAAGGAGDDELRVVGSLGAALSPGKFYAVLDGQEGNDLLETLPLSNQSVSLITIPQWMMLPSWITTPMTMTLPSSVALVGGSGNNTIYLDGLQRLLGIGGDGIDHIKLVGRASSSEIAGGSEDDFIEILASGSDNRVFGDQGNDTITARDGNRLGIFGEQGNDRITIHDGREGFARGGEGDDTQDILGGTRMVITGELGSDQLAIRGGIAGVASGGLNDDTLEIAGGAFGLLLGQSGNDSLKSSGGLQSIVSGGDGDDTLEAANRGDDLYGDDGDDKYRILSSNQSANLLLRLRELLYVDPADFEPESRGADTIDLSAFTTGAVLDLSTTGLVASQLVGLQTVIPNQLQVILLGSIENIIGTQGNDVLNGNSESNILEGRGGNDRLVGLAGDDTLVGDSGNDTLDGGTGDDLYGFATLQGQMLGQDVIYEAVGSGNDGLDFSGLPIGLGPLDLGLATPQILSGGLLTLTIRSGSNLATMGEIEEVVGTDFNDIILGNDLNNRFEPKGGNDTVDGKGGSDVYVFAGRNLGADVIVDSVAGTGIDILDFVAFDAPIAIDLESTSAQNLGEMTLTLGAADAIENVIGTSYDDIILGNSRDNQIFGGAGADTLNGRSGNDRLTADLPVVVLLDFDSAYRADRGDYNYSAQERMAIEQRLNSAYSAFNWSFTQSETIAKERSFAMGRSFVRLAFSQGRGGGVSGDAGEVDFRNINRRLTSEVNINPLLPTIRDIVSRDLGSGYTSSQYNSAYSSKVVALTATIAAHELAHTAGLRHADAFGPIGSGVYFNADLSRMYPEYAGEFGASETPFHIIASPASIGTTIQDASAVTYFGEREAIKLAFNEIGRTQREPVRPSGTAVNLGSLYQLYVPNMLEAGALNSGKVFDVSAVAVVGDLKYTPETDSTEVDTYRFTGRAGEWFNAELMAAGIRPLRGDAFDGTLKIYRADGTQLGQLLAENDDELEGTKDARIQDVLLPVDGDYFITVSLSPEPSLASTGGRYELFLSRFRALPSGSPLPPVIGDTLVGGPGADVIHGGAADDRILATDAVITDLADELYGHSGNDTLDQLGLPYNYTLPVGHSIDNIINAPSFTFTGPSAGAVGQLITFTLDGSNAAIGGRYVINWGDGTTTTSNAISGPGLFTHQYLTTSPTGGFGVTIEVFDAANAKVFTDNKAIAITRMAITLEGNVRSLYVGESSPQTTSPSDALVQHHSE